MLLCAYVDLRESNAVQALLEAIDAHTQPSLIIYLAGVDPLREDRLGRLHVSLEGLYRRDQLVLRFAKDRGIPIAIAVDLFSLTGGLTATQ